MQTLVPGVAAAVSVYSGIETELGAGVLIILGCFSCMVEEGDDVCG